MSIFGGKPPVPEPTTRAGADLYAALRPDDREREVTVWLRSGWKVTGKVSAQDRPDQEQPKGRADVRSVTVLRLYDAKLANPGQDGLQLEQKAKSVLVLVEDIELIGVELQPPV